MVSKAVIIVLAIVGVSLLALSFIYFTAPAHSLPAFLPGFDPNSDKVHIKHGITAFLLALVVFASVWFQSGKNHSPSKNTETTTPAPQQ